MAKVTKEVLLQAIDTLVEYHPMTGIPTCPGRLVKDALREPVNKAAEVGKPEVSLPYSKVDVEELVDALRAVVVMYNSGPCPRKLDESLTWRENDEKAMDMARSALSKFPAKCDDAKREGV